MSRTLTLAGVVALALLLPGTAPAAAPNYILLAGPGLTRPAVLASWQENARLLVSLIDATRASSSTTARPRYDLALFWGWAGRPVPRSSRGANQHGTFYPAFRGRSALVRLMVDGVDALRLAPKTVLRILARHGVPVRG